MKHRHKFIWDKKQKTYVCRTCKHVLAVYVLAPKGATQTKTYGFLAGD